MAVNLFIEVMKRLMREYGLLIETVQMQVRLLVYLSRGKRTVKTSALLGLMILL